MFLVQNGKLLETSERACDSEAAPAIQPPYQHHIDLTAPGGSKQFINAQGQAGLFSGPVPLVNEL
jgi:hypothetical protein